MSERKELRLRIEAKKAELDARLAKLRAEGSAAANDAASAIERELSNLQSNLRDGWDNLSEAAARKLNDWLSGSKTDD